MCVSFHADEKIIYLDFQWFYNTDMTGSWNPSVYKTRAFFTSIVNIVVADGLLKGIPF